jgi:hypothetical protein
MNKRNGKHGNKTRPFHPPGVKKKKKKKKIKKQKGTNDRRDRVPLALGELIRFGVLRMIL